MTGTWRDGAIGKRKILLDNGIGYESYVFFPRRRPVMDSAEELGGPKAEEFENGIPESIDGVAGREI